MADTEYNGWKNKSTWNVALHVGSEECLYRLAVDYVKSCKRLKRVPSWGGFTRYAGINNAKTPDGFKFESKLLDREALREMLIEFVE